MDTEILKPPPQTMIVKTRVIYLKKSKHSLFFIILSLFLSNFIVGLATATTDYTDGTDVSGQTSIGEIKTLRSRYFSVTMDDFGDSYQKGEVGNQWISYFRNDGIAGYDTVGNPVYKYTMTMSFWMLVYNSYPATYFQKVDLVPQSRTWITVGDCASFYTEKHDWLWNLEWDDYNIDIPAIQQKSIGGAYSVPINCSFNIPTDAVESEVEGWDLIDFSTQVIQLRTSGAAEVDAIGSTDAKWTNTEEQTGDVSGYTQDPYSSVTGSFDAADTLADTIEALNLGWNSDVIDPKPVSIHEHNTVSMGSGVQLATENQHPTNSITGNYNFNLGSNFYKYQSMLTYTKAYIMLDTVGVGAGNVKVSSVAQHEDPRNVGFGIENDYIKHKMECDIDIYTTLAELEAEDPRPDFITPDLPVYKEELDFDNGVGGDTDALITTRDDPIASFFETYQMYIIIAVVLVVATLIGMMVLKKKAADKTKNQGLAIGKQLLKTEKPKNSKEAKSMISKFIDMLF